MSHKSKGIRMMCRAFFTIHMNRPCSRVDFRCSFECWTGTKKRRRGGAVNKTTWKQEMIYYAGSKTNNSQIISTQNVFPFVIPFITLPLKNILNPTASHVRWFLVTPKNSWIRTFRQHSPFQLHFSTICKFNGNWFNSVKDNIPPFISITAKIKATNGTKCCISIILI